MNLKSRVNLFKLDLLTAFNKQLLNSTLDQFNVSVVNRILKYQESFHCSTWSEDDLFRHITGITNNTIKISRHSAEKRSVVMECVIINSIIELLESNTPFDIIIERIKHEERKIARIDNDEIHKNTTVSELIDKNHTELITTFSNKYKDVEAAIKLINEGMIHERRGDFQFAVNYYRDSALKAVEAGSYLNYHKAQQRLVELYENLTDKENELKIINETITKLSEVGHPLKYWNEKRDLYNNRVSIHKNTTVSELIDKNHTELNTTSPNKYKDVIAVIKLINEGMVHERRGDFQFAVNYYRDAALKAVEAGSYLNYHKAQQRLVELYENLTDKENELKIINETITKLSEVGHPLKYWNEKRDLYNNRVSIHKNTTVSELIDKNHTELNTTSPNKYKDVIAVIKLINEGMVHERRGDFQFAVNYYRDAALKAVEAGSYLNYHKAQQRLVELYENLTDKENELKIINETITKLSEVGHPLKYWNEKRNLYNNRVSINKISKVESEKPNNGILEVIDSMLLSRHSAISIESQNNEQISIEVPYWAHFYVYSADALIKANEQQTEFYHFFKNEFIKGNYIDIGENNNYAFILMFDLIEDYEKHKDLEKIQTQLTILGDKYPKTARYTMNAFSRTTMQGDKNSHVHNIQINISNVMSQVTRKSETPEEKLIQKCKWIGATNEIELHGYNLKRGNFYLGEKFLLPKEYQRSYWGELSNPFILTSVINPELPISQNETALERLPAYRFSSYTDMTPYLREQYLQWLSGKISVDEVSFDILFHYLYGLELRMFVDIDATDSERSIMLHSVIELKGHILARVEDYNYSIRSFFSNFIDSAISKYFPTIPLEYVSESELHEYSTYVYYMLQQAISDKTTITSDFAYNFALIICDFNKIAPDKFSNHIKNRFEYYFKIQHPRGLRVSKKDYNSKSSYTIQNRDITNQRFLPEQRYISCDIFEATNDMLAITTALRDPYWSIRREFSLYNRFIEEQGGKETLAALFALPNYINIHEEEKVIEFKILLDDIIQNDEYNEIGIETILKEWGHIKNNEKTLHKKYVDSILTAFDILKYGLVPDYRIDKKRFNYGDRCIVFPKSTSEAISLNNAYARMEIFVKMAAHIVQVDGSATNQENDFVHNYIYKQIDQEVNRKYLIAYYEYYKLDKQRIDSKVRNVISLLFIENEKQETIDALIGLCCANGDVSPKKTDAIKKFMDFFGIDNSDIHSRIHRTFTGEIDNFVTIEKQLDAMEFSIPSKSEIKPKFYIDTKKLNKIEQDTKESHAILKEIFDTEDMIPIPKMSENLVNFNIQVLKILFAKDRWDRKDVENIFREHNIMLGSVLENLNDYSYSKVDDAVIEDEGDMIYVNTAYKEKLI